MCALRRAALLAASLLLFALALIAAWRNFGECQARGFSRFYCATTHLVR